MRFQAQEVRMTAIEHQLANSSIAQPNTSIDTNVRELLSRMDQQMLFF